MAVPKHYMYRPVEAQQELVKFIFEMKTKRENAFFWLTTNNSLKDFTDAQIDELSYIVDRLKQAVIEKDWKAKSFTTDNKVAQVLREHMWYVKKHKANMFEIRINLRDTGEQKEVKDNILKRGNDDVLL